MGAMLGIRARSKSNAGGQGSADGLARLREYGHGKAAAPGGARLIALRFLALPATPVKVSPDRAS